MPQEIFPEIREATEALEKRITLTETEIAEMKETMKTKMSLVRSWRKAFAAFTPRPAKPKKKTVTASWFYDRLKECSL